MASIKQNKKDGRLLDKGRINVYLLIHNINFVVLHNNFLSAFSIALAALSLM